MIKYIFIKNKNYIKIEAHLARSESLGENISEGESQRKYKVGGIIVIMDQFP